MGNTVPARVRPFAQSKQQYAKKFSPSATGKPVSSALEHQAEVWSAAFSPDGTRVVTASGDNTARVWDAATGKPVSCALEHQAEVEGAAFSPDGTRVVTASGDNTAQLWDVILDAGNARRLGSYRRAQPVLCQHRIGGTLERNTNEFDCARIPLLTLHEFASAASQGKNNAAYIDGLWNSIARLKKDNETMRTKLLEAQARVTELEVSRSK